MYIHGIGIIFAGGSGIDEFERALKEPLKTPPDRVFDVDIEAINDKSLLRKLRRSDKLGKMSVLAAADAVANSKNDCIKTGQVGIIVATAFGPHVTTFRFLDDILDYGDGGVSPTIFSNSVHNAAASYIAETLNIQGPTLTVTQFHFSFAYALQLAQVWLNEGRCDYVLIGAVDQCGDVLEYVCRQKLTDSYANRTEHFNFKPTNVAPGEGAVFFLVGNGNAENNFCKVENILISEDHAQLPADLTIINANSMLPDRCVYAASISPKISPADCSHLFGSMMIGTAFSCAIGSLILKNQTLYANILYGLGFNAVADMKSSDIRRSEIEFIHCIGYNCAGKKATIILKNL